MGSPRWHGWRWPSESLSGVVYQGSSLPTGRSSWDIRILLGLIEDGSAQLDGQCGWPQPSLHGETVSEPHPTCVEEDGGSQRPGIGPYGWAL